MKTCTALVMILFMFSIKTYATQEAYILYIKSGKLNSFSNEYEKFEMEFDGKVKWKINQSGLMFTPGCGNEASSYQGKLTDEEINQLISLVEKAIESQPDKKKNPRKSKGVDKTLKLLVDDKSLSSLILKNTNELIKLNEYMTKLQLNLSPQSILRMNAKILKNGKLKVRFNYFGKDPYLFLLPRKAKDAFRLSGHEVSYEDGAPFESIQFNHLMREKDITLNITSKIKNIKKQQLRYSNRNILHHSNTDFVKGQLTPESMNVCTGIND